MIKLIDDADLVRKYSVAGPRYTSYPAVPFWKTNLDSELWKKSLIENSERILSAGVSLYIHLPFCESLCTYCGCNTHITTNHSVEEGYIQAVLREWSLYKNTIGGKILINEIHFGGGTPTFFSAKNLSMLIEGLKKDCEISSTPEFSIEGHPDSTTEDHIKVLAEAGFNRISFGIQDFNEVVQKAINRYQTLEQVERVTALARKYNFKSVNYDLIYGLPFQTVESMRDTVSKAISLQPDRIAFYGYAHVPWVKPGQRHYSEKDLPGSHERIKLQQTGYDLFVTNGYREIGMDHFSKPDDSLYISLTEKKLNRNFMGYTTTNSPVLLGLGVSAISDIAGGYAQNVKSVKGYMNIISQDLFPVFRGHFLTEEETVVSKIVKNLLCNFYCETDETNQEYFDAAYAVLNIMQEEGLVTISPAKVIVTDKGKRFIRNICMAIDPMCRNTVESKPVFSATV